MPTLTTRSPGAAATAVGLPRNPIHSLLEGFSIDSQYHFGCWNPQPRTSSAARRPAIDAAVRRATGVDGCPNRLARNPIPRCAVRPGDFLDSKGQEINISDADLDEVVVVPKKLAGLTVVSNELVADSDPSALEIVGAGLVRDLQVRLDAAYFANTTANGPSGIQSIAAQPVEIGGAFANLDPFAAALSKAETVGADITSFVAHPATLLQLEQLKVATSYNQPLLGVDPAECHWRRPPPPRSCSIAACRRSRWYCRWRWCCRRCWRWRRSARASPGRSWSGRAVLLRIPESVVMLLLTAILLAGVVFAPRFTGPLKVRLPPAPKLKLVA